VKVLTRRELFTELFSKNTIKQVATAWQGFSKPLLSQDGKEKKKEAKVMAPEDQLSLAIGKNGQNVRLASKLTGFNIDIEKTKEKGKKESKTAKGETQEKPTKELKDKEAKSETK